MRGSALARLQVARIHAAMPAARRASSRTAKLHTRSRSTELPTRKSTRTFANSESKLSLIDVNKDADGIEGEAVTAAKEQDIRISDGNVDQGIPSRRPRASKQRATKKGSIASGDDGNTQRSKQASSAALSKKEAPGADFSEEESAELRRALLDWYDHCCRKRHSDTNSVTLFSRLMNVRTFSRVLFFIRRQACKPHYAPSGTTTTIGRCRGGATRSPSTSPIQRRLPASMIFILAMSERKLAKAKSAGMQRTTRMSCSSSRTGCGSRRSCSSRRRSQASALIAICL
jgi:hypothetical protein